MNWYKLLCDERFRPSTSYNGETRTEIERDYGRVVFSTPVRRLQDKAQVFPLEPIDAVRTRLTHSMEVSSVARGYAKGVAKKLIEEGKVTQHQAYEIECIAATCGLIHDVGNPPFGHAGEDAIRSWFKRKFKDKKSKEEHKFWNDPKNAVFRADLENFEGNAQTLRLVTKLQILSDRFGLNLTYATLSVALKYTASSLEIQKDGNHSKTKLGYYQTEKDQVEKIRIKTGTGDARHPISLLVEAADDSVYAVVDIEDGIKKGVVTWKQVSDFLKERIDKTLFEQTVVEAEKRITEGEFSQPGKNNDEFISQYFRTLVIAKAHQAIVSKFSEKYDQIMLGSFEEELLFECDEVGKLYKALKDIGRKYVWNSKETLRLELLGRNVIHTHLDLFSKIKPSEKSKTFEEKSYHLLSSNYRAIYRDGVDQGLLPERYLRAILLTDYICGMTDTFAVNLHQELSSGY